MADPCEKKCEKVKAMLHVALDIDGDKFLSMSSLGIINDIRDFMMSYHLINRVTCFWRFASHFSLHGLGTFRL